MRIQRTKRSLIELEDRSGAQFFHPTFNNVSINLKVAIKTSHQLTHLALLYAYALMME